MRIIAGEFRSRKIQSLEGTDIRPTSDRLRETLFNILQPSIEGAVFVDAYAGTGAVGIEALSRGARHVVFIEKDHNAVDLIRQNLASLGITARARVIRGAAALNLISIEADIVFLDPPYPKEHEYEASMHALEVAALKAKPSLLTVVQHSVRAAIEDRYGPLRRTRLVKQGDNALSFFSLES